MKSSNLIQSLPKAISRWGLYIFAISIPVTFVPAQFGVAIAIIGWILDGILNKRWQFYPTKLYYFILFYVSWNIFASSISPRPWHSLWAFVNKEWPIFIMLLMISVIEDIRVLRRILHFWLFSATVAAVYGVWQIFSGVQLHRSDVLSPMGNYFRAVGFNGFYLTFAGFMMSVFLVCLCLNFQSDLNHRWRYIFVTIVSFIAVVGTFARSIWLSFAVAIPIFGFLKGKRLGSMVVIGFLIIIFLSLIFIPAIRDRAFSTIIPSENQTRLNLWRTSINMSKDFLITGIGKDNFDYYFENYRVEGYYDTIVHPHNDYLTVLVNSGIPGLISFIGIWFTIIRMGIRTVKHSSNPFLKELALGSTLAVLGFMVGGFFQNYYGTFANCWGWWFMAGFTMTSHRFYINESMNRL